MNTKQAEKTTDQAPIITIENMHKWYGDFHVLKDINLTVTKGERIVICGPSGSGKSTLIRCINRLEEHQKGRIIVDGTELTKDIKNIEKVRGGLNTATNMAPGLIQCIELVATRKKFEENFVGFTNFVIYSDGDLDDPRGCMILIEKIFKFAPKTTFDFVLITERSHSPMEGMIARLRYDNPSHDFGVVKSNAARKYPMALTATYNLTNRLRHLKTFEQEGRE